MCIQTEFALLANRWRSSAGDPDDNTTVKFNFHCGYLHKVPVEAFDDHDLEQRYMQQWFEMIPFDKRMLSIVLKMNLARRVHDHEVIEWIRSVDISLEGEILRLVHSLLHCDQDEKLVLKVKAELAGFGAREGGYVPILPSSKLVSNGSSDYIELAPELIDGRLDRGKYTAFNLKVDSDGRPTTFRAMPVVWEIFKLDVLIKKSECNCCNIGSSHVLQANKRLLTEGISADLGIIAKDNVTIPCHEGILIAQSPVIEKMLKQDHFVEGSTRKIKMSEWTQEEVAAFLSFLYYGGVESAVKDASINVTLFIMGDYYGIIPLKDKMKEVMMKRCVLQIPVDDALRLFDIGKFMEDFDLTGKALEALKWRPQNELQESELYLQSEHFQMQQGACCSASYYDCMCTSDIG